MALKYILLIYSFLTTLCSVNCLLLPSNCKVGQYYDPGSMECQHCPANVSMVTSEDGFGCQCDEHSIPAGISLCKRCNATEMMSNDGTMCIPRRCQNVSGRFVCRKCPNDYISVTQNLDGSPLKEVQCVKCTRGYKARGNVCVKCGSCSCNKNQIIVRDICIPKSFINARPKYVDKDVHPLELLDIVKHEYLCSQNDSRSCRNLASKCVKNFYNSAPAGPCRLWTQIPKLETTKALPRLTIHSTEQMSHIDLKTNEQNILVIVVAVYTHNGGFKFVRKLGADGERCHLPLSIKIGEDVTHYCSLNTTEFSKTEFNETLAPFLDINGEYKPLSITLRRPDGYKVKEQNWPSNKFRRYFIIHNYLSTTSNTTYAVYLQTLLFRLRLERSSLGTGSLKLYIDLEAQYSMKASTSDIVLTSFKVENVMPSADIYRGLEIWSGALGALTMLYAAVQWRGVIRRGGPYLSGIPLLCGAAADTLYFASLFTTLHALAAEAGTLGMTLPLSTAEDNIIKALVFTAFALKVINVSWLNWKQCQADIFFIDWTEYNSESKDSSINRDTWRARMLAREWNEMQCKRRASPGFTVTLALFIFHVMSPSFANIPSNPGYKWAIATIAWWCAYTIVLLLRWLLERIGSPSAELPKICQGVGLSLLVFEEEFYAHYVHGRNDDLEDLKSLMGTLATCRVVCAPQFRTIYKQLSMETRYMGYNESKDNLLSKFLIAFFERSLEGMSWVASERTMFEKLLNIEITSRESGFISTLLYDDDNTPSCFAVTWWGQEWPLSTFDGVLFGFFVLTSSNIFLAALVNLAIWQIMTVARNWFGNRNFKLKINTRLN